MEIKKNGLDLHQIKSKSTPVPCGNIGNLEEFISQQISGDAFVVAYLDYKVLIGRFKDKKFQFHNNEKFESKYVQKLRVCNETQELLIWRSFDGLRGRLRTDETGNDTYVVDALQVLFGTEAESLNGNYTKISERRGTELILPFSRETLKQVQGDKWNKKNRVCIKTRNYIKPNDVHQATYEDCRFVCFVHREGYHERKLE